MAKDRSDYASVLSMLQSVRNDRDDSTLPSFLLSQAQSAPTILAFVNAHAVNLAFASREFLTCLARSHLLLRDGIGIKWLLLALRFKVGCNLNGTDMIPRILEHYAASAASPDVAILGSRMEYALRAAEYIQTRGANPVLVMNGYCTPQAYLDALRPLNAGLVILGMGMPKQERVAHFLAANLTSPMLIVNGGAILDFWAGRFPRAPLWMRRIGMEWCYRLMQEPRRLAQRYLWGNLVFLARIPRFWLVRIRGAQNNRHGH